MADEDQDKPLPPPSELPPFVPRPTQPPWFAQPPFVPPPQRNNNALFEPQAPFVPPPTEPRDDEINARFQHVLRGQAELASSIDRLRSEIASSPAAREIGPRHNQGPPLQIDELDAESKFLLALLQDKGPRPTPVDRALIAEHAETTLESSDQIRTWLKGAAIGLAMIGAREVTRI